MEIRRPYKDEFLYKYSGEHLKYEVDMFFRTTELLTRPFAMGMLCSDFRPEMLRSAGLEAYVIHLRNLIDFFYLNKRDTDVAASDFYANWDTLRPAMSSMLRDAKVRADKELAHLTTQRIEGTPKNKEWAPTDLTNEIGLLLQLFVKHARTTALSPDIALVIHPTIQPTGPKPFGTDVLVKVPNYTGPISTSATPVVTGPK